MTTPIGAGVRNNVEMLFKSHGDAPNVAVEFNEVNTIIRSVMRGIGYAVMPQLMLKDPVVGKYCREHDTSFSADIALCRNKNAAARRSTEEFSRFIKGFFADL